MDRRLTAILTADVVGYSRLVRSDEEGTIAALKSIRAAVVDPKIAAYHGRIVKLMGDGMLVEFPSVVDAVHAAVETQKAMIDHNAGFPKERRIEFRIGINLGDVVIDGDDIYGDGVNVAARLEEMSEPGGISVSGKVYEEVRDRTGFTFEDLGAQNVKNIDRPLQVWRWVPDGRNLVFSRQPQRVVESANSLTGSREQLFFGSGGAEAPIAEKIGKTKNEYFDGIFVSVMGAFRIRGPRGLDLTPQSMKARGMIAVLLDAPNLSCSRISLQEKLWSDQQSEKGGVDLRKTLTEIRRALGPFRDVLGADRRSVWLDSKRTKSDWHDTRARANASRSGLEFLDGLVVHDPKFNDWVSDRRTQIPLQDLGAHEDDVDFNRPILELASSSAGVEVYGTYILQSIANGVSEFGSVEIVWADSPKTELSKSAFRLELAESEAGDFLFTRLQLVSGPMCNISWQITTKLLRKGAHETDIQISRIVNEGVDRTIDALAEWPHPSLKGGYTSLFFSPVQKMLKTKGSEYNVLRKSFQDCFEQEPRGIYLAWQAFLACFTVGERRSTNKTELKNETRSLIRRAIELEPHNSVVLALASNIYGFVLEEFEVSHELAERSLRLNPNSILGWTFLGNAKLYRNEYAGAYECLLRARAISGEGPYRHLVDCVTCIAAILSGHVDEGISIGETVNAVSPEFRPALRYLLVAYISKGDYERARSALERLRKLEPGFELSDFADPDYPVPALRISGLLDLDNLPKLP